jgi:hypothetical protein
MIAMSEPQQQRSEDPLAQGYRLHARSTAEIVERVENFLSRLNRRGLKFRGRKTKLEPFINVLVLEFFKLDRDQQERLMMTQIPAFEDMLGIEGEHEAAAGQPHEIRNAGVDLSAFSLRATQVPKPKPKKNGPSRTSGPSDHPEAPDRPSLDDKPPMYGATNLPLRSGKRKGRRGA